MSIEAMKQALEAMNAMLTHMGMDEDDWNKITFDQMRTAITSLRQAIAEAQDNYQGSDAAKAAHMMDLYTALGVKWGEDPFAVIAKMRDPQPKAEQKSTRLNSERKWKLKNAFWRMYNHGKNDNPVSAQCEVQALDMFFAGDAINAWKTTVVPRYTHPQPKREPLTMEEILLLWQKTSRKINHIETFARAIEAAHGIKGEA